MVDFGGWDMPVAYGSQIEEHLAVRRAAGVFDVSHMSIVDLSGERTRELAYAYLDRQVDPELRPPGARMPGSPAPRHCSPTRSAGPGTSPRTCGTWC